MAWRWLEGLLGRNKSRSRRNDLKRRLRIEELESRRLLTIVSIGGVIDVSNFPGATGDFVTGSGLRFTLCHAKCKA